MKNDLSTAIASDYVDGFIRIQGLELQTHIGVHDEERANPQRLTANLLLRCKKPLTAVGDDINQTVNYSELSKWVQGMVRERSRCLVETLVADVAQGLLARYPLSEVVVEIRKYVLADTDYVSAELHLRRRKNPRGRI